MISPKVGVAVFIMNNDNKILLGKRKSELGKGSWGLPGGKLEFGEEPEDCVVRELKEETDLDISVDDLVFTGISNTVFDETTQYITLIYTNYEAVGEVKIMEPDKCESWEWFDITNLPQNLFKPLDNYLKSINYERCEN